MTGDTRLSDLTVDQYKKIANDLVRDVSVSHYIKAVDKLFDKKLNKIGEDLTGKDISNAANRLCIRKTFDASQECRINKEKIKDTVRTEGIKKGLHWLFYIATFILAALNLKLFSK